MKTGGRTPARGAFAFKKMSPPKNIGTVKNVVVTPEGTPRATPSRTRGSPPKRVPKPKGNSTRMKDATSIFKTLRIPKPQAKGKPGDKYVYLVHQANHSWIGSHLDTDIDVGVYSTPAKANAAMLACLEANRSISDEFSEKVWLLRSGQMKKDWDGLYMDVYINEDGTADIEDEYHYYIEKMPLDRPMQAVVGQ